VVLPSLIIVGLMVIPYVDVNRGQRLLHLERAQVRHRTFLSVLACGGMITSACSSAARLNLFMPGLLDPHKSFRCQHRLALHRRIRSEMGAMLFGAICVLGWLVGSRALLAWKKTSGDAAAGHAGYGSSQHSS